MGKVRLTPLAEQDLEDIWFFIAQDDPAAADRLLATLDERIALLADNPLMGPPVRISRGSCAITRSATTCSCTASSAAE